MKNKGRLIIEIVILIVLLGVLFFKPNFRSSQNSQVSTFPVIQDKSDIKLLDKDNNTVISVSKNQVISVTLDLCVCLEDYQTPTISDASVLSLSNTFDTSPRPNSLPGEGGTRIWQFKALKEGVSNITITWTDNDVAFKAKIIVK